MSKKSLYYLSAGSLLILWTLMSVLSRTWEEIGFITFDIFRSKAFRYFLMKIFGSWLSLAFYGSIFIAGLVCIAKAFLDDMIPNIVLVGLFGIEALFSLLSFFTLIGSLGPNWLGRFEAYGILFTNLIPIVVFGLMAAIILLKDSFGAFFFVPAAVKVFHILLELLLTIIGLGSLRMLHLMIYVVTGLLLVGALFSLGKAVTDN